MMWAGCGEREMRVREGFVNGAGYIGVAFSFVPLLLLLLLLVWE